MSDLRRRRVLGALAAPLVAAAPAVLRAQAAKPARIGWLAGVSYATTPYWPPFVAAMEALGWREGRDYAVEHASSDGHLERFPALAADLVGRKVDVIVCAGTPPSLAARDATATVPIVFFYVGDPVGSNLVASLARPGGNLTGLGGLGPGIHAKQLELLKEAVPSVRRVAVLHNPESSLHVGYRRELEPVAARLGLEVVRVDLRTEGDVDAAFAATARLKADSLLILGQPFVFQVGERIAQLAREQRLPSITPILEVAQAGALMAYGSRLADDVARVPSYLDRILKGTKPQDLPVEQPTRFYLVVNRATARGLGLTLPQALLARADEVIG
jgi:putative ABC transport system substrate-binding protein